MKKFCLACFFKFICLFLSLVCFNSLLVYAEVANLNTDVPVDLQHQADLSNYYDVYSFDTFFLRQFQLAKESSNFKQENFESLNVGDLKVYGYNDDSNLDSDADYMFSKIYSFLEETKDVSELNFEECCNNYLINNSSACCEKFNVLSGSDFDNLVNDGGYYLLYRGIHNKNAAEDMRKGKMYIGGRLNMSKQGAVRQEGSGVYTTSNFCHADLYARMPYLNGLNENQKGEIVKLALSKDAKLVDCGYLNKVFNRMLERYSDYSYFQEYLNLEKIYGRFCVDYMSDFKVQVEFVKEKCGFDFFADVDKKSVEQRKKEMNDKIIEFLLNVLKFNSGDWSLLSEADKTVFKAKFQEVLDEFLKGKPYLKEFYEKTFFINKVAHLYYDAGFLAKLMDFDVVYSEGACFLYNDYKDKPEIMSLLGDFDVSSKAKTDCFNIVDFGKLFVCADSFKEVDLARAKEVIL